MADVYTLLTLPITSSAFTALSTSRINVVEPGSISPPRKVARLDADSDSASASRPRAPPAGRSSATAVPLELNLSGAPIKLIVGTRGDNDFRLVKQSVRVLLTRGTYGSLPASLDGIYRACQSVVSVYGKGEGIYENVKIELERCIGDLASELFEDKAQDTEWLVPFNNVCAWFEKQVGLLQSSLAYLDRLYIQGKKDLPSIRRLAFGLFARDILENASIMQRLQASIKSWIEWERRERTAHKLRSCIPALNQHLFNHGQFHIIFESLYMKLTHAFYVDESNEFVQKAENTATDFLQHCSQRRKEEQQRVDDILPDFVKLEVLDTTDRALLSGRLDWLTKGALGTLMEQKKEKQLGIMYQLFARVDGLKTLCAAFKLQVQTTSRDIVKDVERDEDMVHRLLEFKSFLDRLVATAFVDEITVHPVESINSSANAGPSSAEQGSLTKKVSNKEFSYALIDAFQSGFKARRNKPAEMIAKYLDRAMRSGQKGKKDEDFQAELDAALGLYRFTDDKDVFRTFYHRALAKRLLLERSASDDFEKAMLKRLKEQYDPEFGMGDHMFNDLALSRDMMREYIEYRSRFGDAAQASAQKLSVMVLQRSFWPFTSRTHDVDISSSMQDELTKYHNFYKNKHQGHKLDWDHALGTATLKARFKKGEKELSVSLYQALVLLLFNESSELTFKEIKTLTRMEDTELRRTLQSLALGKKRVLKKASTGKDVNDDDTFHFNADFTDPRYQVHINSIQVKETAEESKRTQSSIEGDRKHALDAAIVRVMKAKKELYYEQLKTATIDAVKSHFVPEVSMIKQRIQGLVEQEYLRRDEDDMSLYIYVA